MKMQNYLCVDLRTETDETLVVNKPVKGEMVMDQEGEHFVFKEKCVAAHVEHPELHWRLLDRTKHGRVTVNSQHVKVEFYVRHEDYKSSCELADMLASEVETIGDGLCESNLEEEVSRCC